MAQLVIGRIDHGALNHVSAESATMRRMTSHGFLHGWVAGQDGIIGAIAIRTDRLIGVDVGTPGKFMTV